MKRIVILALTGLLLLAAVPTAALAQSVRLPSEPPTTLPGDEPRLTAERGGGDRPATTGDDVPLSPEVRELIATGRIKTVETALERYWTPERMKAARPALELPGVAKAAERFTQVHPQELRRRETKEVPDGPEERIAPAPPARDLPDIRLRDRTRPLDGDPDPTGPVRRDAKVEQDGGTFAAASAGVLTSWQPGYSSSHATARTNGKVFFTKPGVGDFVCSGAVVNSAGKDTVWTAGHCVHGGDGGSWHSNWTFVPAYDDGSRPYGTWSAKQLWTMTSWINDSDFTADIGVAIMHPNDGQHIVSKFGGHGISWNYSKKQYVRAFGYPAEAPFDGGDLTTCYDRSWPEWSFLWISSDTLQIECDMTRGSSGGPWLRSYDGNYGYLNGVNSRINRIVGPTRMYSPYFDNTARNLYNATKNL